MSEAKSEGCEISETQPKLRICCACPETREARDLCVVEKGESACERFITEHNECLRKLGFKVN